MRLLYVIWTLLNIGFTANGVGLEIYPYSVIGKIPLPKDSFTQGLVVDGDTLWLGTGKYGKSKIYQLDLKSGKVLKSKNLNSNFFGEGVTQWGDQLIQLTWKSGLALVYDKSSLRIVDYFSLPGEGWGITSFGDNHYISSGLHTIDVFDAKTRKKTRSVEVKHDGIPIGNLNELEFINGFIFSNIWTSDVVISISPESGQVVGHLDFKKIVEMEKSSNPDAGVLNGIAWNPREKNLLITGKNFSWIYRISVGSGPLSKSKK